MRQDDCPLAPIHLYNLRVMLAAKKKEARKELEATNFGKDKI